MMWRRMLLQAGVCIIGAALAVFGWFAYRHTNSEAVRRQVQEHLQNQYQNVDVEVGSAWLRPLGGISVRDLRIRRRDDPRHPLLTVPSLTIYHDKQQLTQAGRLVVRKVELHKPTFCLRRNRDGNWNVEGLIKPGKSDGTFPTIVIHQGVIQYEDRSDLVARPVVEVRDVHWTLVNDPSELITFQARGISLLGPIAIRGEWHLKESRLSAHVEVLNATFGPDAAAVLSAHLPGAGSHFGGLSGRGDIRLDLQYAPAAVPALKPSFSFQLHDCTFSHPRLPLTLEQLSLDGAVRDNQITIEKCRARAGSTEFRLSMDGNLPAEGTAIDDVEQCIHRLDLSVNGLTLSPELLQRLPPTLAALDPRFKPSGPINLTYQIERRAKSWQKRFIVKAEGLQATYHGFPYPFHDIRGTLDQSIDSTGVDRLKVDLTARAGDAVATIQGDAGGDPPQAWMDLVIRCNELQVDEAFLQALGKNRPTIEKFHPSGRLDVVATIKQKRGDPDTTERFVVHLRDLSINYDAFPYPLENVKGSLDISCTGETRIELRQVRGQHHGGELRFSGKNVSGPSGSVIHLTVEGNGVPLDHDVVKAMNAIKLESAWKTLCPRGRANFVAQLTHIERATPPNAAPAPGSLRGRAGTAKSNAFRYFRARADLL